MGHLSLSEERSVRARPFKDIDGLVCHPFSSDSVIIFDAHTILRPLLKESCKTFLGDVLSVCPWLRPAVDQPVTFGDLAHDA